MAQIVTITNPLTGQPAQVDQLEHTAQEIDDAIARALPGGAIDIALQNNDPRRWGLGVDSILLDSLDNALETGWYKSNVGTPGTGYWNCHAIRYNSVSVTQMAFQYDNSGALIAFRMLSGTTFSPWEWLNPPMELEKEYRTTERYRGKPVYTRLVDFGSFPNSTQKDVRFPENGFFAQDVCIDFTKSVVTYPNDTRTSILPFKNGITEISVNNACVRVTTSSDLSSASGYICVKYTKSTD